MATSDALYNIDVQAGKKVFLLSFHGFFSVERAENFVQDFEKETGAINPQDYTLILDCSELAVFKPDILPILAECYKLYMSKNFKKIVFVNPTNATGKSQLKRVGTQVNLVADFVDTADEAYEIASR